MTLEEQARSYVRKIKNTSKRAYAQCYLEFLLGKRRDAPLHGTFSIGMMATQAVRMHLTELLGAR